MCEICKTSCLLVADDLTGACDAAVQFTLHGFPGSVRLCGPIPARVGRLAPGRVLAITTESRALGRSELEELWGVFPPCRDAQILFKKIDSTLRGSVGVELGLAARAFEAETVVITPAFPAMGRTVEAGWLRVEQPGASPTEMAAYWRPALPECEHVETRRAADAIGSGARFVSVDACSDADLDAIAAAGLSSGRRILWAGSGGLAGALARALSPKPSPAAAGLQASRSRRAARGVLFCIGSNHPATVEQQKALADSRTTLAVSAEETSPEEVRGALSRGVHVVLRIPCGRIAPARFRELAGRVRAPLVLSGGDTASTVCGALYAREVLLKGEVAPGIPYGTLRGGLFHRSPVVTKSGGFGGPDALIQIADYFTHPKQ